MADFGANIVIEIYFLICDSERADSGASIVIEIYFLIYDRENEVPLS
jgi:hypothetical protein